MMDLSPDPLEKMAIFCPSLSSGRIEKSGRRNVPSPDGESGARRCCAVPRLSAIAKKRISFFIKNPNRRVGIKELGCHAHHTSPILRRYDHPQKFCSSQAFYASMAQLNDGLSQEERW